MDRADAILEAVQRTYDAAVTPREWPGALEAITDTTRGLRGFLVVENHARGGLDMCHMARHDPLHLSRFAAAAEAGMLPSWMVGMPVGRALRASDMETDSDYARSAFYNEVVRRNGCFYGAVAQVESTPSFRGYITICRGQGREDYSDADVAALQMVIPHLTQALRLRRHLGDADLHAAQGEAVLDQLTIGVILTDAAARPVHLNRRAEAIIARADGLLVEPSGIAAARPDETRRLREAIALAAAAGAATAGLGAAARAAAAGARMLISRPSGRRPLVVAVIPFRTDAVECRGGRTARVAVFVSDPDRIDAPAAAVVRELFGLTAAEAEVAVEIGRGEGLQSVADRLSIAVTTARTHLAHIFDKTGTSRQAELVRLLLGCQQPPLAGE
ncbi:helix-turn-helix transcriptional regulator [Inquilinus sp. OTU3971]|uniref:helix-turn-helix transcriptional regulator n=1 Tax=Inquilinus sp. OTU3971 TaxID=3043855 RepID=UPI00313C7B43